MNAWQDDCNEQHLRNYDGASTWHVDCYDRKSSAILDRIGAAKVDSGFDGESFDCTPMQAIEYIAALAGLNVEFRKRKRRQLSDEQKAKLAERMRSINAQRSAVLSDR